MPTETPATYTCSVCGLDAPTSMTAECNWCDRRYHLNQRNDIEGIDCGHVWIDEQYMALQFACNECYGGAKPERTPSSGESGSHASTERRRYRRRA